MPDIFTKAQRSEVMSRIRSRGNQDTELALVRVFRAHGITGWRRQVQLRVKGPVESPASRVEGRTRSGAGRSTPVARLSVRPDFVFRAARVVVFVDGCFWHACPRHATQPKGNAAFWRKKLAANVARDRRVNRALRRADWRVVRIWEHALRKGGTRKTGRRKGSTPHPIPLPGRGGEGERKEARLLTCLRRALG